MYNVHYIQNERKTQKERNQGKEGSPRLSINSSETVSHRPKSQQNKDTVFLKGAL